MAAELSGLLGALTARTRRRRCSLLHLTRWRLSGHPGRGEPDELRTAARDSPVLYIARGTTMRQLVDGAIRSYPVSGVGGPPPRLPRYRAVKAILDSSVGDGGGMHHVPYAPASGWVRRVTPVASGAFVVSGVLLQGAGSEHPQWWTVGAVILILGVLAGVLLPTASAASWWRLRRVWSPFRREHGSLAEWAQRCAGSLDVPDDGDEQAHRVALALRDPVLARAFLLDLADEWGWPAVFSGRRLRGSYPILVVAARVDTPQPTLPSPGEQPFVDGGPDPGAVLVEEFRRCPPLPVVLVTDRPGGPAPVALDGWRAMLATSPDGPWTVEMPAATGTPDTETAGTAVTGTRPQSGQRPGKIVGRATRGARCALGGAYRGLIVPAPARWTVGAVAGLLVAVGAFAATRPAAPDPCRGSPASDVSESGEGGAGGERIGYQFCGPSFTLMATGSDDDEHPFDEQVIYQENQRVDRLLAQHPERVAVNLVVITALTSATGSNSSFVAEREGLAGAYAAQRRINTVPGAWQLAVRLVVANAGDGAGHIDLLVDKLTRLLDRDRTVAAALVTVSSLESVRGQLLRLDQQGLVTASPTMTADGFGRDLPHFLQLTSPNVEQARLALEYAGRTRPGTPIVFIRPNPNPNDLYTNTLLDSMRGRNVTGDPPGAPDSAAGDPNMKQVRWSPKHVGPGGTGLREICIDPAKPPVVYYGGRYTEFADFVADLQLECGDTRPLLIADDSVSRLLADRGLAAHIPHGTEVVVSVRSNLLSCRTLANPTTDPDGRGTAGRRADFLFDVQEYLGRCGGRGANAQQHGERIPDIAGGWATASYDTVRMLDEAMRRAKANNTATAGPDTSDLRAIIGNQLTRTDPSEHHTYRGVIAPLRLDSDRVARTQASLYCIPELSQAFTDGTPGPNATLVAARRDGHNTFPSTPDPCDPTPTPPPAPVAD